MVEAVAKAGTLSIVGVYSPAVKNFPLGDFMEKNLKLNAGNCNHRKYIPHLLNLVKSGTLDPLKFITKQEPLTSAIEAYKEFDRRESGWLKVELEPRAHTRPPAPPHHEQHARH
jgi:threonine dehydrogenase-like Zn-dependent dehydrogenase